MESLQRLFDLPMLKGVKLLLIIEVNGNIIGKEMRVQDKWKEFNVKLQSKFEIFNWKL